MHGWGNCVGVRTRLRPDAAAAPRWEAMTSDISGEKRRGGWRQRDQEEGGGGWMQSPAKHYSKYITNVPCGATRVPAHLLSQ